jgi:mono/diheme cytochrome c family protein
MRIVDEPLAEARSPLGGRRLAAWLAVSLALCAGGCRRDMYDQPHYEAYEPSTFFADGTSSRPIIAGTVARGELRADSLYYEGKVDGKDADVFPFAVDAETLELGRERYMVFCTPCHGRLGDGRGMVVRRGFSPPPSFHSPYLRDKPVGHYFSVMSHGYGAMYSYAARIPVKHRWAIAAYIRALQYSTNPSADDLNAEDRKELPGLADRSGQPTRDDSKSLAAEVPK